MSNTHLSSRLGLQCYCKQCNYEYRSSWGRNNRSSLNAHEAKRRASIEVPLTEAAKRSIKAKYDAARRLEFECGVEFHIDHIVPIALGGQHTPQNLQIKTAEYNLSKGARYIG